MAALPPLGKSRENMLSNLFKILIITVVVPAFAQDKLTDVAPNEALSKEMNE